MVVGDSYGVVRTLENAPVVHADWIFQEIESTGSRRVPIIVGRAGGGGGKGRGGGDEERER